MTASELEQNLAIICDLASEAGEQSTYCWISVARFMAIHIDDPRSVTGLRRMIGEDGRLIHQKAVGSGERRAACDLAISEIRTFMTENNGGIAR